MTTPATPRGELITKEEDTLFRVLRQLWVSDGKVSAQNFRPMPTDQDLLSANQAVLATAAKSYELAEAAALVPVGVASLTIKEIHDSKLTAYADPEDQEPVNPAHAVIDFRAAGTRKEHERRSKELRAKAGARGSVHPSGVTFIFG